MLRVVDIAKSQNLDEGYRVVINDGKNGCEYRHPKFHRNFPLACERFCMYKTIAQTIATEANDTEHHLTRFHCEYLSLRLIHDCHGHEDASAAKPQDEKTSGCG